MTPGVVGVTAPRPRDRVANPAVVRVATRWVIVVVVLAHGLLHLLGAAKGLGWAEVPQLQQPISTVTGWVWLVAGALVLLAGILLALGSRRWWTVGAVAVVTSQALIFSSWSDARAGTAANLILLGAVIHGYAATGPRSYRAEYHRRSRSALADLATPVRSDAGVVTDADLAHLPTTVAAYVRQSGAVGQPRVTSFGARIHGQIRAGPDKPWMRFTGEQVNTYGDDLTRLFLLDATMFGVPVDVLHAYRGSSATMRVKAASLIPMVNASGTDMDRAETVTLFNDLCVLAPAALVDARVRWQPVDDHHACGTFTNGAHTVTAELAFNDDHELVDFVSDDRLRASSDGTTFTRQRWSTPFSDYHTFDSRRVSSRGEARWHAPAPEGEFCYLEVTLDDLHYNLPATPPAAAQA
jgi:uncharacterized membrane protein YphA (DoxX/SURF4 family)